MFGVQVYAGGVVLACGGVVPMSTNPLCGGLLFVSGGWVAPFVFQVQQTPAPKHPTTKKKPTNLGFAFGVVSLGGWWVLLGWSFF